MSIGPEAGGKAGKDTAAFIDSQKRVNPFVGEGKSRVDLELFDEYVRRNLIRKNDHPEDFLTIYNYTNATRIQRLWTPVTRITRGLIVDSESGEIVARPFHKMDDVREGQKSHGESITVYDKLDGSLGIMYPLGEELRIATRGSFVDTVGRIDQANALLEQDAYASYPFDPEITYLWEILLPDFPHVVDYGERKELVLIGMVETATGKDLVLPEPDEVPFPVVEKFPEFQTLEQVRAAVDTRPNTEGFIIRKENGARIRIKSKEYYWKDDWRQGLTHHKIWQAARDGVNLESYLASNPVPEERKADVTEIFRYYEVTVPEWEVRLGDVNYINPRDRKAREVNRRRMVFNLIEPSFRQQPAESPSEQPSE